MLPETLKSESAALILLAMDNFLEYVKRRKAALRKELADLEAAERIYRQSGAEEASATLPLELSSQPPRPTIKEAVVKLLEEVYPMGLTALEILDRLNRRWWRGELKRTSLSPQITRLKKDGKVINERGTWKVVKKEVPEAVYRIPLTSNKPAMNADTRAKINKTTPAYTIQGESCQL